MANALPKQCISIMDCWYKYSIITISKATYYPSLRGSLLSDGIALLWGDGIALLWGDGNTL